MLTASDVLSENSARPTVGGKCPKTIFLDPDCVKCVALQAEKDSLDDRVECLEEEVRILQERLRSKSAEVQHAQKRLDALSGGKSQCVKFVNFMVIQHMSCP